VSVSQLLSWNKANCSLSVFDKENSIEFLLDLLHYIYNYYCGYAPYLPWSPCYSSTDFFATCCDCDSIVTSVTPLWLLWLSHDIFPCSTLVIKKRKEKEILNNDLAVLPSHDIEPMSILYIFFLLYKGSSQGFQKSYINNKKYETYVILCSIVQR